MGSKTKRLKLGFVKKLSKDLRKILYCMENLCSRKDVDYSFIRETYDTQNNGVLECCGYKIIRVWL